MTFMCRRHIKEKISKMKAGIVSNLLAAMNGGVSSMLSSEALEVSSCFFQDELSAKSTKLRKPDQSMYYKRRISQLQTYSRESLLATIKEKVDEDERTLQVIETKTTRLEPGTFVRDVENKNDNLPFNIAMQKLLRNYEIGQAKCRFYLCENNLLFAADVSIYGFVLKNAGESTNDCYPLMITMTLDEFHKMGSIFFIFRAKEHRGLKIICTTFDLNENDLCYSVVRNYITPINWFGPKKFKEFNILLKAEEAFSGSDDVDTGIDVNKFLSPPTELQKQVMVS
eukprot:GHVP01024088.1.p1 GENE.GHVP01024088.1~~GHVP01024088.1.p1  ORF type:complete len:283 (+),score=42.88 GHVP01024088.1:19-867(+)